MFKTIPLFIVFMFITSLFVNLSLVKADNNIENYYVVMDSKVDTTTYIYSHLQELLGGRSSAEYFVKNYMELTITKNLTINGTEIVLYNKQECRGGYVDIVSGGTMVHNTIEKGTSECTTTSGINRYYNMTDYLRSSLISVSNIQGFKKTIGRKITGNSSITVNIYYQGHGIYKDLPVHKFYIKINASGKTYRKALFKGEAYGYIYLYIGLLLPVYSNLTYKVETYTLEQKMVSKTNVLSELVKHNLPKENKYGYMKTNSLEIIVGGMVGSNILVTGNKGDKQLYVRNSGDEYGYVLIHYIKPYSLSTSKSEETGYEIYVVEPHENKTIPLSIELDSNVDLEGKTISFQSSYGEEIVSAIVIGIVVAAAIAIIYVIHSRKK